MAKNETDKQTNKSTRETTYKTEQATRTPPKTGSDLWCSGRVGGSYSTCGTRHVAQARKKNGI